MNSYLTLIYFEAKIAVTVTTSHFDVILEEGKIAGRESIFCEG
jgi:hypothetical protein